MSGFISRLRVSSVFNRAAYAGPRRFIMIGGGAAAVAAAIAYASMSGGTGPLTSQVAHLPPVNPLPGGLHSNPQQDKLALQANQEQADQAARSGVSYTPPIAASQSLPPPPGATPAAPTVPAPQPCSN